MQTNTVKHESFGHATGAPHACSRLATTVTPATMNRGYRTVQFDVPTAGCTMKASECAHLSFTIRGTGS